MEVTETQCNDLSKSKLAADDISLIDFYKKYLLPSKKFPNLVEYAKKMAPMFGSTCEQLFLRMKLIKNHLRTKLADTHTNNVLLLASTSLSPYVGMLSCNNIKFLADQSIAMGTNLFAIQITIAIPRNVVVIQGGPKVGIQLLKVGFGSKSRFVGLM